jgi:4-hydroxybenzoate polyprenyltransferase
VLSIGVGLEPWRVSLLGIAMLFDQLSVGFSNDWIDASRDRRVGRTDKPVATGAISVGVIRASALLCLALALVLPIPLGLWAFAVHAVVLVSAWQYNAWLKNTALSVLPFVVSFGLLPAVVTLALPTPLFAAWWALGAGALLGVAAHFANVLPDFERDRATGIRGLPHRLGQRASGIVIAVSLAAASALLLVGVPDVMHVVGFLAGLAIATMCVVLVLRDRVSRLLFRLIIAAALLDVTLLAISGGAVVSAAG